MFIKKTGFILVLCLMLFVAIAGCGTNKDENATTKEGNAANDGGSQPSASLEPVTINLYVKGVNYTQTDIKLLFTEPIQKKYPNITLEQVGGNLEDLIAAGQPLDLILTASGQAAQYLDAKMLNDLQPMIKKNQVDLGKFDQVTIDSVKRWGTNGELFALPFTRNLTALYYNKDLFDKFGVSYPKDGMNIEETISLSQKLTRTEDGSFGLYYDVAQMGGQLLLPLVDPKSNKAQIYTDGWKTVMQHMASIYKQSWSKFPPNFKPLDMFIKDQTLAMTHFGSTGMIGALSEAEKGGRKLNWDLVSLPTFPQAPKTGFPVDVHILGMSTTSKHQAEAFEVMNLVTSADVQKIIAEQGKIPVITGQEVNFGKSLEVLKGKNVKALFLVNPAPLPQVTMYDSIVKNIIKQNVFIDVVSGKKDINTALRDGEEMANKLIEAKK
ncbi:MAG: family 1 extracellular solute-binding protein [Paenibacillaceae bacterium]|jgi:multiple sugar transport system substrate-binding protein|nr:family 1 extracellular solute-binding protein [Paenibacillaceae bacterium]